MEFRKSVREAVPRADYKEVDDLFLRFDRDQSGVLSTGAM
jgi:Ca2+-binding EF-hand superfamily protein